MTAQMLNPELSGNPITDQEYLWNGVSELCFNGLEDWRLYSGFFIVSLTWA